MLSKFSNFDDEEAASISLFSDSFSTSIKLIVSFADSKKEEQSLFKLFLKTNVVLSIFDS